MHLLLLSTLAWAGPAESIALDAAEALELGDVLFRGGDPEGALGWYRVAAHLAPRGEGADLDAIWYRAGLAQEAAGLPQAAVVTYEKVGGAWQDAARLRAGVAAFAADAPNRGDEQLARLAQDSATDSLRLTATLMRGTLWLERGERDRAATAFETLPPGPPKQEAQALLGAHAAALRSPALAAGLSLVPGLGQTYADDPRRGRTLATVSALGLSSGALAWWGMKAEQPMAMGAAGALGAGMVINWGRSGFQAAEATRARNAESREAERVALQKAARAAFPDLPRSPLLPEGGPAPR